MTMLEKAARVVYDCALLLDADECERVARAVLQAIREPSESIEYAMYEQFDWGPPGYDDAPGGAAGAGEVWRAMIDAALSENG